MSPTETGGIVERLRKLAPHATEPGPLTLLNPDGPEATALIEQKDATIAELVEALADAEPALAALERFVVEENKSTDGSQRDATDLAHADIMSDFTPKRIKATRKKARAALAKAPRP